MCIAEETVIPPIKYGLTPTMNTRSRFICTDKQLIRSIVIELDIIVLV